MVRSSAGCRRRPREPRTPLDEGAFRYAFNEDAMATEKLAEGIRVFAADVRRLEALIQAMG